ncbi:MAG TPA: Slp family lipoprotein [Nitrospiria bacterium]|nr:Slp family lipoprotein [Nitrospiria bacterium]
MNINGPVGALSLARVVWAAALFFIINGCGAPVISKGVRDQADPTATFKAVFHDPDAYKGKTVLWGGIIIRTRNAKDVTWIELVQEPLAGDDRPIRREASEGRFLIRHDGFLDPAVYGRGREVTLVGEVRGLETRLLDEAEYRYPVVADKQLVLWGPAQEPAFHFNLGFGAVFSR